MYFHPSIKYKLSYRFITSLDRFLMLSQRFKNASLKTSDSASQQQNNCESAFELNP